jgi:glycosyltransferase involved in cell wall biosynthesis
LSRIVVVGAYPQSLVNFRGDLLKALVAAGHDVTAMSAEAAPDEIARLADIGVAFRSFPIFRNTISPVTDLQTWRALRAAFRLLKPDVVLAYTIKPVIWSGFALKGTSRPRFYALVTGLGFAFQGDGLVRRSLRQLVIRLYRSALARASRIIFQNTDNRDAFVSRQIVAMEKCAIVNGSGVHLDRFDVSPLPETGVVFLTMGRLLGDKGFREFAEAAQRVKAAYPDAVFRLVGQEDPSPDGIRQSEIRAWVAAGWLEHIDWTSDVRPLLRECHVYVLASYHEGMPRTVLEAMAMGRPILTTDVPGCRDTVVAGENGYLIPERNAAALAERMIWFIEHRDQWARMGARSRALAEDRFDVHKVNGALLRIMELA